MCPTNISFAVLDCSDTEERRDWVQLWAGWDRREVFAHPEYVRLYTDGSTRGLAATLQCDAGFVLYPFLLRPLGNEPFAPETCAFATDISTPYGYGGPFCWGAGSAAELAAQFWPLLDHWLAERLVVSEFIRFSLLADTLLPYPGVRERKGPNIVRDLTLGPDDLWRDFEYKVRKNVSKAHRSGIRVEADESGASVDQFAAVYEHTLRRRGADDAYFFGRAYFETVFRRLAGSAVLFHAYHDNEVVSSELVLLSADSLYSFLGGTLDSAYEHRPNELLKYSIMEWGMQRGFRRFVLGGGYVPGDGIERYKSSFAPSGVADFYIGRRVLRPDLYTQLCSRRAEVERSNGVAWAPDEGFFPAYRS